MTIRDAEGATAHAVNALKGNPLCLAVVILVIVLSLIAYYRESSAQAQRTQVVGELISRCMEPAKR